MKENMKKLLCLFLSLVFSALLLTGCGEKSAIKNTISNLEGAIRTGNIEGILECYDPSVSSTLQSAISLFGIDSDSVSSFLQMLGVAVGDEDETDGLLSTLKITPQSYEFSSDKTKCTVTVLISYTIFGEEHQEETTFNCIEVDGKWYVK